MTLGLIHSFIRQKTALSSPPSSSSSSCTIAPARFSASLLKLLCRSGCNLSGNHVKTCSAAIAQNAAKSSSAPTSVSPGAFRFFVTMSVVDENTLSHGAPLLLPFASTPAFCCPGFFLFLFQNRGVGQVVLHHLSLLVLVHLLLFLSHNTFHAVFRLALALRRCSSCDVPHFPACALLGWGRGCSWRRRHFFSRLALDPRSRLFLVCGLS
jgi:hypothetical protein